MFAAMPPPHDLAPLIAILAAMLIPIIVILTRHQQKMTALMHRNTPPESLLTSSDMALLQREMQELKSMVSSLAINVDSLKSEVQMRGLQDRVRTEERV